MLSHSSIWTKGWLWDVCFRGRVMGCRIQEGEVRHVKLPWVLEGGVRGP